MRTVFFGTPEIAVPALRALAATTELVAVFAQPDRPAGRGLALAEPAVKRAARELALPVHQPARVRDGALAAALRDLRVEAAVVLAYGRILPPEVLAAPARGCLNLHASLLPRWRGAAPIQWALFAGDAETGVSLMQMDPGLDTGPVFSSRALPILPEDDAGSLAVRLGELAATVVREDLPLALSGALVATPQDATLATHAPPLATADAELDFTRPAREVHGRIRGLSPRPGAFSFVQGRRLKILSARVAPEAPRGAPGEVVRADRGGIWIACGDGAIELISAQPEGRRALSPLELVNGRALRPGERLGA